MGMVNRLVPDGSLEREAFMQAEKLAHGPTAAFGLAKRLFRCAVGPSLEDFFVDEHAAQTMAFQTSDHREGVRAFLEKRKPEFTGR
jgi:2-(1,2-epoxy-1,2-dihydrophenyl)acetyl-CoA isomerase